MAAPQKLMLLAAALKTKTTPTKSKIAEAMDKCDTPLEKLIEVLYAAHESHDHESGSKEDESKDSY